MSTVNLIKDFYKIKLNFALLFVDAANFTEKVKSCLFAGIDL